VKKIFLRGIGRREFLKASLSGLALATLPRISLNCSSLLESSSIPARTICSGSREPVVSTVKIYSSSLSVFVSADIFAEFHLACSVPLPSRAYASSLLRCPGAKYAIGI